MDARWERWLGAVLDWTPPGALTSRRGAWSLRGAGEARRSGDETVRRLRVEEERPNG